MLDFEPGQRAVYGSRLPAVTRTFDANGQKSGLAVCHRGQTGSVYYRTIVGRKTGTIYDKHHVYFVPDGMDAVFVVEPGCIYLGDAQSRIFTD